MFSFGMGHSQDEEEMIQAFDIEVLANLRSQILFSEYLQCAHCSPVIRITRATQWAFT